MSKRQILPPAKRQQNLKDAFVFLENESYAFSGGASIEE
jgi:hypothetical protein